MENFNIFRNLGLYENHHSNLLKKILWPRENLENKYLFIDKFLELLQNKTNRKEKIRFEKKPIIETEYPSGKGKIDIYVKLDDHVLIIENKINNAPNQPSQLYRYWKNEIYSKERDGFVKYCKRKNIDIDNINDRDKHNTHIAFQKEEGIDKKYTLIYLTYSDDNIIYNDSKKKPNNKTYNKFKKLPSELPFPVTELNYKTDIYNWLEDCISSVELEKNINTRLVSIILQYMEGIKINFKS